MPGPTAETPLHWLEQADGCVTLERRGPDIQPKRLELPLTRLTRDGASALKRLSKLRSLSFLGTHFPTSSLGMAEANTLDGLKRLRVNGAFLSEAELADLLAGLEDLEVLDIAGTAVDLDTLRRLLTGAPRLRRLAVGYGQSERWHRFVPTLFSREALALITPRTGLLELRLRGLPVVDADLEQSRFLEQIEVLDLGETHITDRGLSTLAGATRLADLRLDRCAISDASASSLAALEHLVHLDLSWTGIGGATVQAVTASAEGLSTLKLQRLGIDADALGALAGLDQLETLDLSAASVDARALVQLLTGSRLRDVQLAGIAMDEELLIAVASMPHLAETSFSIPDTEHAWQTLARLEARSRIAVSSFLRMTRLPAGVTSISTPAPPDDGFSSFGTARHLKSLWLSRGGEAFADLPAGGLSGLRELALEAGRLDDRGLARLAELPRLEALYISGNDFTNAGVEALRDAPFLHTLEMRDTQINDASIAVLKSLAALHCLDVPGTAVTDRGIAELVGAPNLQSMALDARQLTRASTEALAQIPSLFELYLYGPGITAEHLRHVARIPHLVELKRVGGDWPAEAAEVLAQMPRLRAVDGSPWRRLPAGGGGELPRPLHLSLNRVRNI